MRRKLMDGRHEGLARPSNVIEAQQRAARDRTLLRSLARCVEFFVKAFSDAGDVVFDPFMGSGTTMAAAALLDRTGYGCEISPAYCDVIVRRVMNLTGDDADPRSHRRNVRRRRGVARRHRRTRH